MEALPVFDPDTALRPGSISFIIGLQNTGKTTLVLDLLRRMNDAWDGYVYERGDGPSPYTAIADRISHRVEEFNEQSLLDFLRNRRYPGQTGSFVVMEQWCYDAAVLRSGGPIRLLANNSRSLRTSLFITALYAQGMPPSLRATIDFLFVFRDAIENSIRRLHEGYLREVLTLDELRSLIRSLPADRTCLVFDFTARTNIPPIYRYTAQLPT